jgi:hypothetical protein
MRLAVTGAFRSMRSARLDRALLPVFRSAISQLVVVFSNCQIKFLCLSGLGRFRRMFRILSFLPVLVGFARARPPFFRCLHKT